MTTEDALLAAIWESPHDDLPRLVYADWCDENGQVLPTGQEVAAQQQHTIDKLREQLKTLGVDPAG